MPYSLEDKFVVGISSSALFDTSRAKAIYDNEGLKSFIEHQIASEDTILDRGTGFPLVEQMLRLNRLAKKKMVEVVILSHNNPAAGLRAMNSVDAYKLGITRAAFISGTPISQYLRPYQVDLFLSTDEKDVRDAVANQVPAGLIFKPPSIFSVVPNQLRIAFDGDAVIFSDESERIYKEQGIDAFYEHEKAQANNPMTEGPFTSFLRWLATVQEDESVRNEDGTVPIRTALVTARDCPAHKRVILTLRAWGVSVDEMFFLGGIQKDRILHAFQPHIFFDDQEAHVGPAALLVPSARVLGGVTDRHRTVTPAVPEVSLGVSIVGEKKGADTPERQTAREEVTCTKGDFEVRCRSIFLRYTPLGTKRRSLDTKYKDFIVAHADRTPVQRAKILQGLERYDLSAMTTHDPLLNREDEKDVAGKLQNLVDSAVGPKQAELGL